MRKSAFLGRWLDKFIWNNMAVCCGKSFWEGLERVGEMVEGCVVFNGLLSLLFCTVMSVNVKITKPLKYFI